MIGRLNGMDAGAIEIAGLDVASTKSKDLAKVVSILRQENHFVTRLTVRQLVGFGRFPHSQGRLNRHDEEVISQAIDFLDLGALEGATSTSSPEGSDSGHTWRWCSRRTRRSCCSMNPSTTSTCGTRCR